MIVTSNNEQDIREVFDGREDYSVFFDGFLKSMGSPDFDNNFINLWEKPLYGKMDNEFVPIIPRYENIRAINEDVSCVSFVADAFHDFSEYFTRTARKAKIRSELINLISEKGFTDPIASYYDTVSLILEIQSRLFYGTLNKIFTFKDYLREVEKMSFKIPLSLSGYVSSSEFGIYQSGIAINYVNDDITNDLNKITKYYDKDFFKILVESARRFGFYVDRNVPWRLVADLNSLAMQYYMQREIEFGEIEDEYEKNRSEEYILQELDDFADRYNDIDENYMKKRVSLNNIFKNYYVPAYAAFPEGEHMLLRRVLIGFWDSLVSSGSFGNSDCSGFEKKEFDVVDESIDWLDFYLKVRLRESRVAISDSSYKNLIGKVKALQKSIDSEAALRYIQHWIVKRSLNLKSG